MREAIKKHIDSVNVRHPMLKVRVVLYVYVGTIVIILSIQILSAVSLNRVCFPLSTKM